MNDVYALVIHQNLDGELHSAHTTWGMAFKSGSADPFHSFMISDKAEPIKALYVGTELNLGTHVVAPQTFLYVHKTYNPTFVPVPHNDDDCPKLGNPMPDVTSGLSCPHVEMALAVIGQERNDGDEQAAAACPAAEDFAQPIPDGTCEKTY
jgi:hypothetical protein